MVSLDWRVDSRDGVALVELFVANSTDAARRVRIADRLDGALWPPRRRGVPEAGWDDGGFEGVVAPGERRALGYASPAPAGDSPTTGAPAEIVWTERAGESVRAGTSAEVSTDGSTPKTEPTPEVESTPEGVVRALGDARPPADAVPRPDVADGDPNPTAPSEPSSRRSP